MTNTSNVIQFPKSMFPAFSEDNDPKYKFRYEVLEDAGNGPLFPNSKVMSIAEAIRMFSEFLMDTPKVFFGTDRVDGLFEIGSMSISTTTRVVYVECDSVYAMEKVANGLQKQIEKRRK